jgi:hypothetical protein
MLAPRSMLHSVRGECELLPLAEHWVEAGIPWWWRSEVLRRMAVTLLAAVVATYLARLLM